jgi:hypothetical protein
MPEYEWEPDQDGVLTSAQASRCYGREHVRAQLRARRWQRPVRGVVVLHNGPLTDSQRRWVALLASAPGSALAGMTALAVDEFEGFAPGRPKVVQPMGSRRPSHGDVTPHWSVYLGDADVHPLRRPRRTRPARSLLDEASWSDAERRARALILAGVQQRIVRPRDLRESLFRRGACRHRGLIVESILDAVGGIQSLPELDFELIRRRRRLPPPARQADPPTQGRQVLPRRGVARLRHGLRDPWRSPPPGPAVGSRSRASQRDHHRRPAAARLQLVRGTPAAGSRRQPARTGAETWRMAGLTHDARIDIVGVITPAMSILGSRGRRRSVGDVLPAYEGAIGG